MVGGTAEAQAAYFLSKLDLPEGAHVVDMGCGSGRFAKVLSELSPLERCSLVAPDAGEILVDGAVFSKVQADYHETGLPSGTADAVLFMYSFLYSRPNKALAEARRLLKPNGKLLLWEPLDAPKAYEELFPGNRAMTREFVLAELKAAGFVVREVETPEADSTAAQKALAELSESWVFDATFAKATPTLIVAERGARDDAVNHSWIAQAFARHPRVAFEFSGGRDSLAALYLLRPYWGRMTVYHTDTGDQFPETQEVVSRVEAIVPRFVRIKGRLQESIEQFGLPTDLSPAGANSGMGAWHYGSPRLQDRYDCCYRSLMAPMHERVTADGCTLVIRGQRDTDYKLPPMRSGESFGVEVLYPIERWNDDDVLGYLQEVGVAPARFYEHGLETSPECMRCSAWWDDKRAAYMKQFHPEAHKEYVARLVFVRNAIMPHLAALDTELEG